MSNVSIAGIERALPYLTAEEKLELQYLMRSNDSIWSPLPGPQIEAYYCEADVLGYGGAAGGGKTDLLIGKALTKHTRTAIFRREATSIGGIVDRIAEIIGTRNGYSGSHPPVWREPAPGKQIEFGSCPNVGDEMKYMGRAKDLLGIDEATHFLESQVRFLMGWVRTTKQGQKCQTILTMNPPDNDDAMWLIKFFAPWLDDTYPVPAAFGELRYFAMLDGEEKEVESKVPFEYKGELIIPQSRTFILSKVTDNPFLSRTGYVSTLQAMPEPQRSRLLYADFKTAMADNAWQVIPSAWVEAAMARWQDLAVKPPMTSVGVDVARGGRDKTAMARKHGNWWDKPLLWPGIQTPDGPSAAGLVMQHIRNGAPVHVELPGVGESVYDNLKMNYKGLSVAVNVGMSAETTDKNNIFTFSDRRSELWWKFREYLDPDANNGAALPPDPLLKQELCAPRWRPQGRMVYVESRGDIIKRIGHSPDVATAYILALIATPTVASVFGSDLAPRDKIKRAQGHDPYAVLYKDQK